MLGRIYFTSNNGSQNTFVYQPTLDILELKKDKCTVYVLNWKSNGRYNSKFKPLYTAFLHSILLSFLSKIANVYIVYDLDVWPRNPTNNFKFKNRLFGPASVVKVEIKKSMCIVATE